MNKLMRQLAWLLVILVISAADVYGAFPELNTLLMRSTFKIAGANSFGTVFIVGKPLPEDSKSSYYILVTAAHVLNDIKEDQAILFLRKKQGEDSVKLPFSLTIRNKGVPLWKQHPKADVAVMYAKLPRETDVELLPMSWLVTDKQLEEIQIHPGDPLFCLGYPYGAEANEAGFPVLRSGHIASYPLIPTNKIRTFLYDFKVFKGNSGGPVYFVDRNRNRGGGIVIGTFQFIAGLVSQESALTETITSLGEKRQVDHPLSLAVVVHASLIKETIDLLPEKPE